LQDLDPHNVTSREKIPGEVLRQGWLSVFKYLLELSDEFASIEEIRLNFTGNGEQGKTSLMLVLIDKDRSTCAGIDPEDRTVGVDMHRG
jgi:hypothetical protein